MGGGGGERDTHTPNLLLHKGDFSLRDTHTHQNVKSTVEKDDEKFRRKKESQLPKSHEFSHKASRQGYKRGV